MELYETLADLRKKKGLSQMEVARELNVSRQSVSKWETGISVPSTDNLICLSKLFDVPMEHFFSDNENGTTTESGCLGKTEGSVIADSSERKRGRNVARTILCICALLLLVTISVHIGITWGAKEEDAVPIEKLAPKDITLDGTFSIEPLE